MELSYHQRVELLDLVKKAYTEHWNTILEIDLVFKEDKAMDKDKEDYYIKKQAEAYDRKQLLDNIKNKLILSL